MNCAGFLLTLALPVYFSVPLLGQDAEVTGTSSDSSWWLSDSIRKTQLDYASAVYYDLGATIRSIAGDQPRQPRRHRPRRRSFAPNRALETDEYTGQSARDSSTRRKPRTIWILLTKSADTAKMMNTDSAI